MNHSQSPKEFINLFSIYLTLARKNIQLKVYRRNSQRQDDVKMAEGMCVGCENITKYLCLKCNALAYKRSLKCSVPASENYLGWKEWTKVVLCFKCDKAEHAIDVKTPLSTARIIRFSKRGGLAGSQILDGDCWERGG